MLIYLMEETRVPGENDHPQHLIAKLHHTMLYQVYLILYGNLLHIVIGTCIRH
jgi:hypothetical protein